MDSGFGGLNARQIGITASVVAELCTLMDGLAFASPLEFSHLVVELDAFLVVSFLINFDKVYSGLYSLEDDCKCLFGESLIRKSNMLSRSK